MIRLIVLLGFSWLGSAFADEISDAVNDESRVKEAVMRDAVRKPIQVLRFSEVQPNDRVLEIAPAGGYYTALLSRVVGEKGRVYAVDPERIFEFFPAGREGFQNYWKLDKRENVHYSIQKLDELDAPGNLDQIWMVLYYHDTLWTGEDRRQMNRRMFELLKPGGTLLLLDHSGMNGAGAAVAQSLHRMDASIAESELTAAGFQIEARSKLFRIEDDPKDDSVFAEHRRGRTDRFLWRLRKPNHSSGM